MINKKGVGALGMLAILAVIVISIGIIWLEWEVTNQLVGQSALKLSEWSKSKIEFDSDISFLENVPWILSGNFAYRNGMNGTLYGEPLEKWDKIKGLVCWNCGMGIPSKESVKSNLTRRINSSYKEYFDYLNGEVENHTPLQVRYENNKMHFSYLANLSLSSTENNYYMNSTNTEINVTTPFRYLLLYDKAKDFAENEEINETVENTMDEITVCTESGALTQVEAEAKTRVGFGRVESDWSNDDVKWILKLANFSDYSCEPNFDDLPFEVPEVSWAPDSNDYIIYFDYVVNSTVQDKDEKRKIPVEDEGMKRLGINFGLNKSVFFLRSVKDLSSGGSNPQCNTDWPSEASCTPEKCQYWKNKGEADDCGDNEDCYVQRTRYNDDSCNCSLDVFGCKNKDGCVKTGKWCKEACKDAGYDIDANPLANYSCQMDSAKCDNCACLYDFYHPSNSYCKDEGTCHCYRMEDCPCSKSDYYTCTNSGCQGPPAVFYNQTDYDGYNFTMSPEDSPKDVPFEMSISSLLVNHGYKVTLNDTSSGSPVPTPPDKITFYGSSFSKDLGRHERRGGKTWDNAALRIGLESYDKKPKVILYREKAYGGSNRGFNKVGKEITLDSHMAKEVSSIYPMRDGFDLYVWDGNSHLITASYIQDLSRYNPSGNKPEGYWDDKIVKIKIISE